MESEIGRCANARGADEIVRFAEVKARGEMDKHNSLVVTEIAVLALFAAIAFPIAGFVRDTFHLNKWLALVIAVPLTAGIMWLLNSLLTVLIPFFMPDKISKAKK